MMTEPLLGLPDDNDEGRKITTQYSSKIGPQQFDQLKFWSSSFLQRRGNVNDATKPIQLYEALLEHCEGDTKEATSIWCQMLATVGLEIKLQKENPTHSDTTTNERFLWGAKMVELSDKLYEQQSIMYHLHTKFGVQVRLDDLESPIALFQHMVQEDKLTVGEPKSLETVEEFIVDFHTNETLAKNHTKIAKSRTKNCRLKVAAFLFLLFIVLVCICGSMTKFTFFEDLHSNRTVYYNGNVTLATGELFGSGYYHRVDVQVAPRLKTTQDYYYKVLACQVNCVQDSIVTTHNINFTDTIKKHENIIYKRDYIRFPGFEHPQIPAPYMLKGSSIDVSLVSPVALLDIATFVVSLHLFTNATECSLFFMKENYETTLDKVRYLNRSNGFSASYTTTADDFICIVTENATVFNYSVNAAARQYKNLSNLMEKGLCLESNGEVFHTGLDSTNATVKLELSRRITRSQQTCVLVGISSSSGSSGTFDMHSTVYGTLQNIGVLSLSSVSILVSMFLVGGLMISTCLCVYSRCHKGN